MLAQYKYNIVEEQLNPVAETINYKQFILYSVANLMAQDKTVYSGYSGLITKLIKALQSHNIIVEKVKKKETLNKYIAKAGE